jgi:hypothetical protein
MLTFPTRTFVALLAFSLFTLLYISVGIRWHTYRAYASKYARQEVEHTFEAAHYARAARITGNSEEAQAQANRYRGLARQHERAARENSQLREFYEKCW